MKLWEAFTLTRKLGNFTEGAAIDLLATAGDTLKLKPSTVSLLRAAIADHFETCADTLRDPKAGVEFCAEGQAPPRPFSEPPQLSDAGFELE